MKNTDRQTDKHTRPDQTKPDQDQTRPEHNRHTDRYTNRHAMSEDTISCQRVEETQWNQTSGLLDLFIRICASVAPSLAKRGSSPFQLCVRQQHFVAGTQTHKHINTQTQSQTRKFKNPDKQTHINAPTHGCIDTYNRRTTQTELALKGFWRTEGLVRVRWLSAPRRRRFSRKLLWRWVLV